VSSPLVLVVEPHDDSRAIYSTILRHAGFQVHATACAAEGLRHACAHPPRAVVLGLAPQRARAMDTVRCFRDDPATARIPVLALSTVPRDEEREWMLDAGCAAYLAKPCTPLNLLAEVRRVIGG